MKFVQSLRYAFDGIIATIQSEKNFRVQIALALFSIAMGLYLNITFVEWMILILTVGSVLAAELINTSIESVVNLVSPQFHPLAKKAKDAAAGAALVLSIGSLFVGWFIFGIKIQSLFFNA